MYMYKYVYIVLFQIVAVAITTFSLVWVRLLFEGSYMYHSFQWGQDAASSTDGSLQSPTCMGFLRGRLILWSLAILLPDTRLQLVQYDFVVSAVLHIFYLATT